MEQQATSNGPAKNQSDATGGHETEQQQVERKFLWAPSAESVAQSQLADFQKWVAENKGVTTTDYASLHAWSIDNLDEFWTSIWEYFGVIASQQPTHAVTDQTMPGTEWFPNAKLNYVENILKHARTRPDEIAVIGEHESATGITYTWAELEQHVASLAHQLRTLGVNPGDTVAGVLPHIPQTIVALFAAASVGAIWSVVNTDFGINGVADRLAQIKPKVLFTVDGYEYGGKVRDMTGTIPDLREALPTVEHVIVVDQLERSQVGEVPEDALYFSEVIAHKAEPHYEQLPFDHPLWVLYSSGTTGTPKGIVHSHGGILLEGLKAAGLQYDVSETSRAYFAVSTTWVVWNILVNLMSVGTAIITYDGAATHGTPGKHFEIMGKHRVNYFGTGAAVLTMIEKAGFSPGTHYDLSALKAMLVTGSPLPDTTWEWIYREVGPDIRVGSDSGGTDVSTAFIGSNPFDPVYRGELMGSYLGVAAEAWNIHGQRVWNEVGEFIVTKPMPSMPTGFWNDTDGSRYRSSYFEDFPGVWRHGDWVTELDGGQFVIHGRSDSTINRGGIRMGSSDITNTVDEIKGVKASMVIGAELSGGDYYMPLFVVPEDGHQVDESMKDAIVQTIRNNVSPRYVPDEIIQAPSIPRTKTGKTMEVPVKKLFQGADKSSLNPGAAENPESLNWYVDYARVFRANRDENSAQ